jgi:predicted alpha/beta superfamily hydrolase
MLKGLIILVQTFISIHLMAQHIVTMNIQSLPQYHSPGSEIYLAGSFNGWNPQDAGHRFNKDKRGNYSIQLSLADGSYEYKLTRGSWETVECKANGASADNHELEVNADASLNITVEEWKDRFPAKPKESTASKNVRVVDTAFYIPQLKRTRKIWIYLPENYHGSSQSFPVLYMQDGQNVFDDATSFAGEWGVDDYLDSVYETVTPSIVVAIENGGPKRMYEYNPYDTKKFGKGEGKLFADFIVKTLKPFIDKNYRTRKDKASTAIAGSSMGGLISLYTLLQYPRVFGGAGIFSPSLWIAPKIFDEIKTKAARLNSKIYFYVGKQEDEEMVVNLLKAVEWINRYSKSKITAVIREDGRHNEATWRREFPFFYEWLVE